MKKSSKRSKHKKTATHIDFPIPLTDTHVLVSNEDGRVAVWQRANNPFAPLVFTNRTLAQQFHRNVLKRSAKWRVERVTNVIEFLGFGVYLRLPNGFDMFMQERVPQAA
jgi:hypothetical protein